MKLNSKNTFKKYLPLIVLLIIIIGLILIAFVTRERNLEEAEILPDRTVVETPEEKIERDIQNAMDKIYNDGISRFVNSNEEIDEDIRTEFIDSYMELKSFLYDIEVQFKEENINRDEVYIEIELIINKLEEINEKADNSLKIDN